MVNRFKVGNGQQVSSKRSSGSSRMEKMSLKHEGINLKFRIMNNH